MQNPTAPAALETTQFRFRFVWSRRRRSQAAEDDPSAILHGFADASAVALDHLKADIDGDALREAVRMMDGAKAIYVIGRPWPRSRPMSRPRSTRLPAVPTSTVPASA